MLRKFFIGIVIFILLFNIFGNVFKVYAESVNLVQIGTADKHLRYLYEDGHTSYVNCSIVGYYIGGDFHPAYCMNKNLDGAEKGSYNVNLSEMKNRPEVWRVVMNGYPYLQPHQMGLEKMEDAYAVTKFALYCVLGESKLENYSAKSTDPVRT